MSEKLPEEFKAAREDFIKTVGTFPHIRREEKLFGDWDLKDVLSHFSAWNIYFTNAIRLLRIDELVQYWGNIDDFNEREVSKRRNMSWPEIYDEFISSGEEFISEYLSLSKDLRKKLFWQDKKYTPEKLLKINIDHYKNAQIKDIKRLSKKSPRP